MASSIGDRRGSETPMSRAQAYRPRARSQVRELVWMVKVGAKYR